MSVLALHNSLFMRQKKALKSQGFFGAEIRCMSPPNKRKGFTPPNAVDHAEIARREMA
jgi:hypothetical protein